MHYDNTFAIVAELVRDAYKEIVGIGRYCAKRGMKDARPITMKNGKPASQGTCPVCGTKMFGIGKV